MTKEGKSCEWEIPVLKRGAILINKHKPTQLSQVD